jgi:hypothetical protein
VLSKSIKIRTRYKTIVLPMVLNGCETWSVTLSEKRRLRVFDCVEENIWTEER